MSMERTALDCLVYMDCQNNWVGITFDWKKVVQCGNSDGDSGVSSEKGES